MADGWTATGQVRRDEVWGIEVVEIGYERGLEARDDTSTISDAWEKAGDVADFSLDFGLTCRRVSAALLQGERGPPAGRAWRQRRGSVRAEQGEGAVVGR